jgi:acyl-coenzyme A thioesterase PaaI-like protein
MLYYTADELMDYGELRHSMSGPGALGENPIRRRQPQTCISLTEDRLVIRRSPTPDDLRPGPLWAGPSLLSFVDNSAYLLTVAHLPPGSDAFTIDLYIKFLRPAPYDDLIAETRLLRMSKRKADLDVIITLPDAPDQALLHATATFSPRAAIPTAG